ncbi:MAG TPA: type II CAAX endopeptidase family protein [Pyrinomonadaceae bacterium]|nr:type II CAAX endopeptidase family protein [Pyrinomonadaceae bacterium]
MSTSNERPAPPAGQPAGGSHFAFAPWPPGQLQPAGPVMADPNNPPWGAGVAFLLWLGSIVLSIVVPILFLIPYAMLRADRPAAGQSVFEDKTALFLLVLSTLPVHLLTLALVWAVVTRFGKLPFWRGLGWSWSERVGFWTSAGIAVLLLAAGLAFMKIVGGEPTELDKLLSSSTATRVTIALLAALTAPLVEEIVYRGVLYPALQRAMGMTWAVVLVSVLFTLPHVPQYRNNLGVIMVILVLSLCLTLVRALTGRLLPCFIIHLVFNGIQSVIMLAEPYFQQSAPDVEKVPAVVLLAQLTRHLF